MGGEGNIHTFRGHIHLGEAANNDDIVLFFSCFFFLSCFSTGKVVVENALLWLVLLLLFNMSTAYNYDYYKMFCQR